MTFFLILAHLTLFTYGNGVTLPEKCLREAIYPCAIYASQKMYFDWQSSQIYLAKGSSIELLGPGTLRLGRGTFWFKINKQLEVNTTYGTVFLEKDLRSEMVIDVSDQGSLVSVLKGQAKVKGRGASDEEYRLSAGFEMDLGPIDYQRHMASFSSPQSILFSRYVKNIEQVFPFSELNFQDHINSVGRSIQSAVEVASHWSKTIVEAKISKIQQEELRQKYESEHSRQREIYLKNKFREKNNFQD